MLLSEHVYCVAITFKMTEQVKPWICITFCVKLQHSSIETIWMIQKATALGKLVIGSFIMKTCPLVHHILCRGFFLFKDFIYLFLEKGEARKKGRETSLCGCLLNAPYWGPGWQPRHVPYLGNKPMTLWLVGQHSIHSLIPARAHAEFFGKTSNHPGDSALLQPRFGILKLLAFPQSAITFEKGEISDYGWDSGKYDRAAGGDLENCEVPRCLFWRGLRHHCTIYNISCTLYLLQ